MTEDRLIQELRKLHRWFFRPRVRDSDVNEIAPRASEDQLRKTEELLGFPLPPLLRRIYTDIGNGGFGPGYGLIGCVGGYRDERGDTIVETYQGRHERDPYDLEWDWPAMLVPLFSWGGAAYTCGDFHDSSCPLVEFDPNFFGHGAVENRSAFAAREMDLMNFLYKWIMGESVIIE